MDILRKSTIVLVLILVCSIWIMASVSLKESATMDELAHIPAGYGYVRYLDYRLNPEHPPLVKMLSGLPLLFADLNFPTESAAWESDVNGQWVAGSQFLYESGNDADKIIQLARIGPMVLTALLILLVYVWAKELIGKKWALLPTALTAFSPTILSHGHYVTTDIGAALGILASIYFFSKLLSHPSKKNILLAGIAFGAAQLMKFSSVILIPYMLLLAVIFSSFGARRKGEHGWFLNFAKAIPRVFGKPIAVFVIGFFLIYPFYFLTTLNYPPEKQLADTTFILGSFADGPAPQGENCKPMRCIAELNIWAADKPLLRPYAQYMLGVLMVIQRSSGGNTAYFLGEVSAKGSRAYFPVVYALKEPLPVIILTLVAFSAGAYFSMKSLIRRKHALSEYLGTHTGEFALILFILFYTAYSMASPLNIGLRHLIPIMPPIYILVSGAIKKWVRINPPSRKMKAIFVSLMLIWFGAETALAYPSYLSYFNEAGGGTRNGWKYVTDSNYDWGQDLKRLDTFRKENDIEKIAVDYFGGGSPSYYLGDAAVPWRSSMGNPLESNIEWIAVSVNTIQSAVSNTAPGFERSVEDEYRWLANPHEPYARAGTSIFIYKLK